VIRTAHTADLEATTLAEAKALLWDVFADSDPMTEADWEHCLGGLHVLAYDRGELVGHVAVVLRWLRHGDRALRCGYVEGVGVRATEQRRGIGTALMRRAGQIIQTGYDLGALGATEEAVALYTAAGWVPWRGPLSTFTASGVVPTPDEAGWIYVLPAGAELDLDAELTCDWRDDDAW
jgi:aminoglycoside 2'-N-acetyltransferase I